MIDRYTIVYLALFIVSLLLLTIELEQDFHILVWETSEQTQKLVLSFHEMSDFMIFGITGGLTVFSGFAFILFLIWGD